MDSSDVPPEDRPIGRPLLLVASWLLCSVALRFGIEITTALLMFGVALARGLSFDDLLTDPEALTSVMSATLMGAASLVQIVGLTVLAYVFSRWVDPDARRAFALGRPGGVALGVAFLGGFTVGFFPGWVAQTITENVPFLDWGNLEMLNEMLASATWVGKAVMLVAIALAAPLCEELIFRGFLWTACERAMPRVATWLLTSALFALYHVDPVHVIAVFFTGLFLGWIRWTTGSVWPAVAAHFANNALAAVVVLALPAAEEATNGAAPAIVSVIATFAFGAALWALSRRGDARVVPAA